MNHPEEQVREIEKNVVLLLNKLKDNYLLIKSLQSKLKELAKFIEKSVLMVVLDKNIRQMV